LAATNAPLVMDLYHNPEFVFGCDHLFADRYRGEENFFKLDERRERPDGFGMIWETNFIADVRGASIDAMEQKGAGVRLTVYEIAGNVLVGHLAEWPVGRYHKAHYHGGGAILLIVRSIGYTLMWPPEAGPRPYESGNAAKVAKIDWREGSVFSPPTGWFHQHFNTGPEPARQLAIRYGSHKYGVGFHDVQSREGTVVSIKQGGTMIEYEDEDPEIRRQFKKALAANGVEFKMPEFAYAR
jgi:oxalate decarboxylase/phosphoglucose isomerase-like protein (cupin superfamily)